MQLNIHLHGKIFLNNPRKAFSTNPIGGGTLVTMEPACSGYSGLIFASEFI
jgi:hypothetical protein